MKPQTPDMSPGAVTHRLRRVAELVRVCRALAGSRRPGKRPRRSVNEPSQPAPLITRP